MNEIQIFVCRPIEDEECGFFLELDRLEAEEEARLGRLERMRQCTFIWQLEQMIKQTRVQRILKRLNRVRSFDIWPYYPAERWPSELLKRKSRQQSMLIHILSDLYNFHAFDYRDPYQRKVVPLTRMNFLGLRRYYREYTGPKDGPRSIASREARMKLVAMIERHKEKYNGKR